MSESRIVVVGAGVSGLTTALLLSKNPAYKITVVAKHMPGDYDIEYASPWAGANYLPVSQAGSLAAEVDASTWPELERLARDHPESGIHFQNSTIYSHKEDTAISLAQPSPWWKDIVPNFTLLPPPHPQNFSNATSFTSVCINTAIYLPYLASQCLLAGIHFHRANLTHIASATSLHHSGQPADIIINCTGLSARKLGGVMDEALTPARGQTVLVQNEADGMYATSRTAEGAEEMSYVMQRAAGGGTLLGGSYQVGNWDGVPDPNLAVRIMSRAIALCPALTNGKGIEALDIIRHGVGLRPLRKGGVRLEKERVGDTWVVHNYGHGGFGYQSSYGCAGKVVGIVGEILKGSGGEAENGTVEGKEGKKGEGKEEEKGANEGEKGDMGVNEL